MFFWHVGATIAFTRYAFRDEQMDLRFLAAGAVLPNLIDLPIGIAMWSSWQTPRLFTHSLTVGALAMVVVLIATGRGDMRKRWMLLPVGMLLHLALDAMWADPGTLWWPFLGWGFTATGFEAFAGYSMSVLSNPWMWAGEIIGFVYLAWLWRRSNLGDSSTRGQLLSTGRVNAPIGRR